MGRRRCTLIDQCVTEGDVPRVERVELVLDVRAAVVEPCRAVQHAFQRDEGQRRAAKAFGSAHERGDVLDVEAGRRAFDQVLAEHVIEMVGGCVSRVCGTRRLASVAPHCELSHRRGDVVGAPRERVCEIAAEESGGAARPEQEADAEADGESDRDVLDSHDADPPADRLDDVEEHDQRDREARLAGGERDRPRRIGGEQDRDRQDGPEHRVMRPDRDDEERADDDPDRSAGEGAHDRPSGGERVRAQHGERSEHDPETVLQAQALRDEDGNGEGDRAADAVPQPDRAHARVLERKLLGCVDCRRRGGDIRFLVRGDVSGRRAHGIQPDLPGRIGRGANAKRRLQGFGQDGRVRAGW